jgi:4-hydroxybenzoate polyprenyltransferase
MAAYHSRTTIAQYVSELSIAFVVAFLMRSFACTINDICDYEFDKGVGTSCVCLAVDQH